MRTMGTRSLKNAGVVAWLLLGLIWADAAGATVLNVPQKNQEQDQWCWAACSQAILEYYGTLKTQTEIAQYGTDGANIWNWLYGSSSNPTRNGMDLILDHFAGLATTSYTSLLSQLRVGTEINARRPFVIRWEWVSGGGHFVVGKGIDGDYLYLMDPWYGPTINTYSWVCQGSTHTWTHSLTLTTSPRLGGITAVFYLLLGN
jgi:ABC-type bacteriocin/lantibiotic exporter with double-glycine peptidase domain